MEEWTLAWLAPKTILQGLGCIKRRPCLQAPAPRPMKFEKSELCSRAGWETVLRETSPYKRRETLERFTKLSTRSRSRHWLSGTPGWSTVCPILHQIPLLTRVCFVKSFTEMHFTHQKVNSSRDNIRDLTNLRFLPVHARSISERFVETNPYATEFLRLASFPPRDGDKCLSTWAAWVHTSFPTDG